MTSYSRGGNVVAVRAKPRFALLQQLLWQRTHQGITTGTMWSFNPVAFVLFVVELYHILGHAAILFRVRLLPRKDLVRIRFYFLFDAASVFITCFLYTGKLRWLASLHLIQHLFYFITWNKSSLANKIMDWSSLDYFKSHKKDRLELDSILGTAFDIAVHVLNVYMLTSYLPTVGVLLGLAVAHGSAYFILYNPRLAWSSPSKMPAWIERRIRPLET
ncbi:uncharacterized protein LOC124274136 isoform X1 [Haliotis rubra]|uniref:uncharacterized protein LOC124274136 isoform X1 n=2 Tax=Haliotis rubra TaxID=36100 RepID=UPI001EE4EFAC|nr:uncharacterized protein LOC124274136 isoform X1 [Haliotis rubra]